VRTRELLLESSPVTSPWSVRSWVKWFRPPRPVLTVHVSLDNTGRGATFSLYRESDQWEWDWTLDKDMGAPAPYWAAKTEIKCRYAIAAMEERLDLPRTFPLFADIPDVMKRLPNWPWDPETEGPPVPSQRN
jgi:hypothetical protein